MQSLPKGGPVRYLELFVFVAGLSFVSMGCGESLVAVSAGGDAQVMHDDEALQEQEGWDMDMDASDMWYDQPTADDMNPTTPDPDLGEANLGDPVMDDIKMVPDVIPDEDEDGPAEQEPSEDPDPEQPDVVTVKTTNFRTLHWNIAGGKENGCKTEGITRAVMRYVKDGNAPMDFISLNEVCRSQYLAIRSELVKHWGKKGNAKFSAFEASGKSRVGVAIFSRQNLRGITRHEVGADKWGKRHLLCGRQVNRRVRVCTTHLTPGDATARKQLVRVLARIEGWWHHNRDTVIIGGDFNIQSNDPGFDKMYSSKANTPNNRSNHGHYREWDDNDANHCKGYGQRSQPGTTRGPCQAGSKIDFIFARENRIVNQKYGARTLDIPRDCTGVCSDHRAVRGWARIRFRKD